MLYNKKDIPELNKFYHRNDTLEKNYVDYENNILDKSLSPHLYSNSLMAKFLTKLNPLISLFFDQFNILKNYRNFTVDKYYNKQTN